MNKVRASTVTLCYRLIEACGRDATYALDILWPFAQRAHFSLVLALDDKNFALTEYKKLGETYYEVRNWLNLLMMSRSWHVPVSIRDLAATGETLYLEIFRGTVSQEKALLVHSKQHYAHHELDGVRDDMYDIVEATEYVRQFAKAAAIVQPKFTGSVAEVKIIEINQKRTGND